MKSKRLTWLIGVITVFFLLGMYALVAVGNTQATSLGILHLSIGEIAQAIVFWVMFFLWVIACVGAVSLFSVKGKSEKG